MKDLNKECTSIRPKRVKETLFFYMYDMLGLFPLPCIAKIKLFIDAIKNSSLVEAPRRIYQYRSRRVTGQAVYCDIWRYYFKAPDNHIYVRIYGIKRHVIAVSFFHG